MAGGVKKETFQSQIAEICRKNKASLHSSILAVLEAYKYADWAVVARAVDGNKLSFWEAGEGQSTVGDRERAMILVGEIEDLKDVIVQYWRKRQA